MKARFDRGWLLPVVWVRVITLMMSGAVWANAILFNDDFNRSDGAVGNGWTKWWGPAIGSPNLDIVIQNGQLKTLGWGDYAGGIFRSLPVAFPIEFCFRFRTEEPPSPTLNGGWEIMFNADALHHPNWSHAQVRFFQYWGWGGIGRAYMTAQGQMKYEDLLPAMPGQRAFRADVFATVSGEVQADLSSLITVTYNDGLVPESVSFSFPPVIDAALAPPGDRFILGNAEANYGPHWFDDLWILEGTGNHAPVVGEILGPLEPVAVSTAISAQAAFTDADDANTHTAVWDWGDGSTETLAGVSGLVTGTHVYSAAGIYTFKLTVQDQAGATGGSIYRYAVIYDPNGGFVTGGGAINSPPGTVPANPSLVGKATFGFVSKYKKGATVPEGQTEFNFNLADIRFHSSSYDWLVVAGAHAQFKGTGTLNGIGSYGFMLTGTDGQVSGGMDPDTFRIKIWDKVTDTGGKIKRCVN